ncbi:MAG TPA: GNAT family N-acetyltransferase [Mycobacterium sp.]|nr:GNAT family N-acetyltransferase [Mycobacterium sp.]
MDVRLHDSAAEFAAIAGNLYRRDPIGHTVELSGLAAPALPADAVLLTAWVDGRLAGAAVQTPPHPLMCGGLSAPTVEPAVTLLARTHSELSAVRGPNATAEAFASAWQRHTGAEPEVRTGERLHRLGDLVPPTAVAGEARPHRPDDVELLADWTARFFVEAFGSVAAPPVHRAFLDGLLQAGVRFVLWTQRRRPVSMAMIRPPVAGVSRIGPVYTPEDERGHGYGSAVTAAASRTATAMGADEVVLFTDIANPVPNAIYRRIGFRPVSDWLVIGFAATV